MLPSVCCLADARLVRLFPAVGRWGSSGLLAVLAMPAVKTKKPRNRLLGCVAKRWLAPRKVHAVLDGVKILQQGRCRQEKPRKEASLCLPHLLVWSDSRPAVLAWASRRFPGQDAPAGQRTFPQLPPDSLELPLDAICQGRLGLDFPLALCDSPPQGAHNPKVVDIQILPPRPNVTRSALWIGTKRTRPLWSVPRSRIPGTRTCPRRVRRRAWRRRRRRRRP